MICFEFWNAHLSVLCRRRQDQTGYFTYLVGFANCKFENGTELYMQKDITCIYIYVYSSENDGPIF